MREAIAPRQLRRPTGTKTTALHGLNKHARIELSDCTVSALARTFEFWIRLKTLRQLLRYEAENNETRALEIVFFAKQLDTQIHQRFKLIALSEMTGDLDNHDN